MKFKKKKHEIGFYQADPMPSTKELDQYYSEKYFQDCPPANYKSEYTDEEKKYFYNFGKVAEFVWNKYADNCKGELIDIGCGEGFFSEWFNKKDWVLESCDFSSYGIKAQHPNLLKYFSKGDIYNRIDELAERKKFDFVNLSYVLEHVRNPIELIDKIKGIMKKETLLRIQVPNDYSDFQKMLTEKKFTKDSWFAPPDHLNYFTFKSLTKLLKNRKLTVVKMLADFPMELFLYNEHSNYFMDRSKGPQANIARIGITNYLIEKDLAGYVDYMQAAANIGFGRSVIAFVKIGEN